MGLMENVGVADFLIRDGREIGFLRMVFFHSGRANVDGRIVATMLARGGQRPRKDAMTTLEVKLDLPDRLAREALAAGLLTPKALREMLKDAMQRRSARALAAGAAQGSSAGIRPLSMREIQAEVNAVRRERRAKPGNTGGAA